MDPGKRRRNFEFVHGLVQQAQKAGELDRKVDSLELTHGIFGAVSHQVRTHLLQPNGPLDARRAKRVVALFLKGARPTR